MGEFDLISDVAAPLLLRAVFSPSDFWYRIGSLGSPNFCSLDQKDWEVKAKQRQKLQQTSIQTASGYSYSWDAELADATIFQSAAVKACSS